MWNSFVVFFVSSYLFRSLPDCWGTTVDFTMSDLSVVCCLLLLICLKTVWNCCSVYCIENYWLQISFTLSSLFFRRALLQMSTSPEAFHVLRSAMLTSHAAVSICQYILGIGDRHLSNFMINLKTGHMVGIDFGHAFGTATQVCMWEGKENG